MFARHRGKDDIWALLLREVPGEDVLDQRRSMAAIDVQALYLPPSFGKGLTDAASAIKE